MFGRFRGHRLHHMGWWVWGFHLLVLLLLAAVVVVGVLALIRLGRSAPASAPRAGTAPSDPALGELRLRYARGEVSREEYLQRAADLGDQGPPAPRPATAPPPTAPPPTAPPPTAPPSP